MFGLAKQLLCCNNQTQSNMEQIQDSHWSIECWPDQFCKEEQGKSLLQSLLRVGTAQECSLYPAKLRAPFKYQ